ncbi:MAG: hypothetical protein WCO53_04430 [Deltaproteobacteria bacterium]
MMGRKHHKKNIKVLLSVAGYLVLFALIVFSTPEPAISGAQNDPDAEAVMQAAINYFDAEVRRDYPAVYACFAPSSDYVRTTSYEQYLAETSSEQQHLVKYSIIAITYIKNNEKRLTKSSVEKIAEVEVDVTLLHAVTKYQSEVNIGFIFFKEDGKWYKS